MTKQFLLDVPSSSEIKMITSLYQHSFIKLKNIKLNMLVQRYLPSEKESSNCTSPHHKLFIKNEIDANAVKLAKAFDKCDINYESNIHSKWLEKVFQSLVSFDKFTYNYLFLNCHKSLKNNFTFSIQLQMQDQETKIKVFRACKLPHEINRDLEEGETALFFGYMLPLHRLFAEAFYRFRDWAEVSDCLSHLPVEVARWALTQQDGDDAWTPLHFATGSTIAPASLTELIIKLAPISVALSNIDGLCSLHVAAYHDNVAVIQMLTEACPYGIATPDFECETPFQRCHGSCARLAMMQGFVNACCDNKFEKNGSLLVSYCKFFKSINCFIIHV